jgi:hypothetical protein
MNFNQMLFFGDVLQTLLVKIMVIEFYHIINYCFCKSNSNINKIYNFNQLNMTFYNQTYILNIKSSLKTDNKKFSAEET